MVSERHNGSPVFAANRSKGGHYDAQGYEVEADTSPAPTPRTRRVIHTRGHSTWVGDNWDKILMAALSVVVSGVIGFFAAIKTIDSEVSSLKEQIAYMKGADQFFIRRDEVVVIAKDVERLREQNTRTFSFETRLDKVEGTCSFVVTQFTAILSQLQILQYGHH